MIDSKHVPEPLLGLIPLVKKWGITDSLARLDAVNDADESELLALIKQLDGSHEVLEDWLYGATEGFSGESDEANTFAAMYQFEGMAGGKGVSGKLDWAIRRYQNVADERNRLDLEQALDAIVSRGRRFIRPRQAEVDLAKKLLERSGDA